MSHTPIATLFTIAYFAARDSHVLSYYDSFARTSYKAEIELIDYVFDTHGTTPIIVSVTDQNGRHYEKGVNRVAV